MTRLSRCQLLVAAALAGGLASVTEDCSEGSCPAARLARDSSLLQSKAVQVKRHEAGVPAFEEFANNKYCSRDRTGTQAASEEACKQECADNAECGFIVYYHGRPFQNKRCFIISSRACNQRGTSYKPTKIWRKVEASEPAEVEPEAPPPVVPGRVAPPPVVQPPPPALPDTPATPVNVDSGVEYTLAASNKFCSNNRAGNSASSEESCKEACTNNPSCGYLVYYHGRPYQGKRCWLISATSCSMSGTSYKPTKIWKKPENPADYAPTVTTPEPSLGLNSDVKISVTSAKRASKHFYEAMRFWDGQGRNENQGYWSLGRDRCKPDCLKSQVNPNLRRVMNVGHFQQTFDADLFNFKWGPKWEYFNGGYCNELVYYFLAMSGFGSPKTPRGWAWLPTLWNCQNEGLQTSPGGRVEPYCGKSSRGRNWAVWGNDATADPKPGDVVALACGGAKPTAATKGTSHTTYFWMVDPTDPEKYWTLGGNQPATNAKWYPKSCFSFIRRSNEMEAPNAQLAQVQAQHIDNTKVSMEEVRDDEDESEDSSEGDPEAGPEEDVLHESAEALHHTELQQLNATRDDWREPTYYGYSKQWRGEYWYDFDPAVDDISFPEGQYRLERRQGATYSNQNPTLHSAFHVYRLVPRALSGNHGADTVVYFITLAAGKHMETLRLEATGDGREKLVA